MFPVSGDEQEVQLRRRELQEGAGPAGAHARPGQVRRVRGEGGGAGRGGRGDAAPRARHPAVPRLSRQLLQVIQTWSDCYLSSILCCRQDWAGGGQAQCRWCCRPSQGKVVTCVLCPRQFCKQCLRTNLGPAYLKVPTSTLIQNFEFNIYVMIQLFTPSWRSTVAGAAWCATPSPWTSCAPRSGSRESRRGARRQQLWSGRQPPGTEL